MPDWSMKTILREGHWTDTHDPNSPSKVARIKRPLAGSAGWYRMRGIRNSLSISRIRGDSETLLGAYGYVNGGNWNRQQMAVRQNCWRDPRHWNQSQSLDIPWTGREFCRRRLFFRVPVLRRRPHHFLRRLPGHLGWASG